jgi:large subunit ribosomal protein L40
MRPLSVSPVLASLANVFKIPLSQSTLRPTIPLVNQQISNSSKPSTPSGSLQSRAPFSTTAALLRRKPQYVDRRISMFSICSTKANAL